MRLPRKQAIQDDSNETLQPVWVKRLTWALGNPNPQQRVRTALLFRLTELSYEKIYAACNVLNILCDLG